MQTIGIKPASLRHGLISAKDRPAGNRLAIPRNGDCVRRPRTPQSVGPCSQQNAAGGINNDRDWPRQSDRQPLAWWAGFHSPCRETQ